MCFRLFSTEHERRFEMMSHRCQRARISQCKRREEVVNGVERLDRDRRLVCTLNNWPFALDHVCIPHAQLQQWRVRFVHFDGVIRTSCMSSQVIDRQTKLHLSQHYSALQCVLPCACSQLMTFDESIEASVVLNQRENHSKPFVELD